MAWVIHISCPSKQHAIDHVSSKATELIPDLTEPEALQVQAAVALVKATLARVPDTHSVSGWLEGRVGPRYQTGSELQTHFGCHIASKERE